MGESEWQIITYLCWGGGPPSGTRLVKHLPACQQKVLMPYTRDKMWVNTHGSTQPLPPVRVRNHASMNAMRILDGLIEQTRWKRDADALQQPWCGTSSPHILDTGKRFVDALGVCRIVGQLDVVVEHIINPP